MSRHKSLPPALREKWGHLPYIQYKGGYGKDEWSAACPWCGESGHIWKNSRDYPDRFTMWPAEQGYDARGYCRNCGQFEWAENADSRGPSPEAIEWARKERIRLANEERERVRKKVTRLQQEAYWHAWHESMSDEQRGMWHQQGIIDYFIDYYELGYRTDHTYYHNGNEWQSPAMTIPHWQEDHLTNIQFRLTEPQPGAGKYRQMAGLPAAMFLTEPEDDLSGAVLILEGAKKAVVAYTHLGRKFLGHDFHIVGIPSKTPSGAMIEQLKDAEPVYILLDPDAYVSNSNQRPSINTVVQKLGRERVRVAKTPVKPDDLIVQYGGTGEDLLGFLKDAARA